MTKKNNGIEFVPPSERCRILQYLLNAASSVYIHLDPSTPGTVIPGRLRFRPQVVLQIGRNMPVPIPDLRVDIDGIHGTLAFNGIPFTCFVPWRAVFAVRPFGHDRGMAFQDAPPAVLAQAGLLPPNVTCLVTPARNSGHNGPDRHSTQRDKCKPEHKSPFLQRKSGAPIERPTYLRVVK